MEAQKNPCFDFKWYQKEANVKKRVMNDSISVSETSWHPSKLINIYQD